MDPRIVTGRMLVIVGMVIAAVGAIILAVDRVPFLGRLPGDISIHGRDWSFHFPLVTGLVISLVLTLIVNLFFRR